EQKTPLDLPADATNIRVSFAKSAAQQFLRIIDDLDDYPYGCVEQTASRLLPLSLLLQSLPQDSGGERAAVSQQIRQRVQSQRLRLTYMAGPNAVFGWWGNAAKGDLLLTAYAYYADYIASGVLGLQLPAEHWENLLHTFKSAGSESAMHRALALWMASEMGLPTQTLARGLFDSLGRQAWSLQSVADNGDTSPAFVEPEGALARAMTLALSAQISAKSGVALPKTLSGELPAAKALLQKSSLPSALALALTIPGGQDSQADAERILESVRADMPTFDRALTLALLYKSLGDKPPRAANLTLQGTWRRTPSITGGELWRFNGGETLNTLTLAKAPETPVTAFVQYDSAHTEGGKLGVTITRKLSRMSTRQASENKEGDKNALFFAPEELSEPGVVQANDLYLEEITLTPSDGVAVRYGIVEVPLPPGSEVENTTWGIRLAGGGALEKATHQPMRGGYAVPVERLAGTLTVRHLVRFSQRGKFNLPPIRFYSMYAPRDIAQEDIGGAKSIMVK
ncbi:MAG: alpha-2-macroglobulin family protein, partial [Gammaproteobacteria bacterium]|nr:alpha-2-macroglobulin family protein [Gammaproteobacteria bacterium]